MKTGRGVGELRRRENGWRVEEQGTEPRPFLVTVHAAFADKHSAARWAVLVSTVEKPPAAHVHVTFPSRGET